MKNAEYIKELEESMYIDGVLLDGDRLEQVRIYVRDNNITDYIILDDDTGEYPEMDDHIYIVDSQTGFTRNDIRNCRKKLHR